MVRQNIPLDEDDVLKMQQMLINVLYHNVESCYCYTVSPDFGTSFLKSLGLDKFKLEYKSEGIIHYINVVYFDHIWKYILEFNVNKAMKGGFSFRKVQSSAAIVSSGSKLKPKEDALRQQEEDERYHQKMLDEELREYYGYDFYY